MPIGDVNVPPSATLVAKMASRTGATVLDSSACHQKTGNLAGLTRAKSCSAVVIMTADGRVKVVDRSGSATHAVSGRADPTRLRPEDVLLVPGLTATLFFIWQATRYR